MVFTGSNNWPGLNFIGLWSSHITATAWISSGFGRYLPSVPPEKGREGAEKNAWQSEMEVQHSVPIGLYHFGGMEWMEWMESQMDCFSSAVSISPIPTDSRSTKNDIQVRPSETFWRSWHVAFVIANITSVIRGTTTNIHLIAWLRTGSTRLFLAIPTMDYNDPFLVG